MGGKLAEPAKSYPRWFDTPFWRAYPYLLPSLVIAVLSFLTICIAGLVLEETLASKRVVSKRVPDDDEDVPPSRANYGTMTAEPSADSGAHRAIDEPLSVWALLSIPAVRAICISSFALSFAGVCYNNVLVLIAYAPIDEGGLSMTVSASPPLSAPRMS